MGSPILVMELPSWIYRSERVGKNGKKISIYKVNTMIPAAHNKPNQFGSSDVYTKWGRFLRKTKIDELPQILNVLKGDLNIVGPRPDFQDYWDIAPEYIKKKILSIKPGLTSLASIYFHDEEQLLEGTEDKIKNYYTIIKPMKNTLDMFYIEHRDFFLDLWIVWRTAIILLKKIFKK